MASFDVVPANDILFSRFCALLETLFKRKGQKQEQNKILSNFINDFRINVAKVSGKKDTSFFPVLRLLLPEKERERAAYNLKEKKLGLLLVNVLSLNKQTPDAQKLLNFRSVSGSTESDFAGVAYFVLKSRVGKSARALTIGDINVVLDKIATAEVGNKGPILDEAFSYVLKSLSADEIKWFLRIVLKDLKIGMGANRILAGFHPDAPSLFDSCNNLAKVCEELEDGNSRPPELGLQLFYAVCPMLSERLDVTRAAHELPTGRVYHIENKFDGERFQIHMENGKFEYFSRKGFSYSDSYGKTYDGGIFTPLLKGCFSPSVVSCILDGEMMGWHKERQCFGSKGMAFDVKKVTENSKFRPCFCAFDVLYYNGKSLVGPPDKGGLPLKERLNILKYMFTDVPGVIMHSQASTITNNADILNALNKAIEDQEEGIVVKDIESYYIVNKRNAGWYKVKPEYTKNTMEDLDLVVIGADEAENKRQGRAKSFHVAVADVATPGDAPHRWVCVGRVAIGFTFEEREKVCVALQKHWLRTKHAAPPPHLVFNKEVPDYWIAPEHSIVLTVLATELIRSSDFGTDYTMRFPRVTAIREDKPVNDVLTLNGFNKLVQEKGPVIKLSTKLVNQDQIDDAEVRARRKRPAKVLQVPEQFRTKANCDVEVTSQALAGKKVYVLSGDGECKKPELEKIVESHGGKAVANNGPDTWCTVVGSVTYRARCHIQAQDVDIVTANWLRSLPHSTTPCKLSPLDMLSIKPSTKLQLSMDYDSFGDSYTKDIDEDTLNNVFKKMDADEHEIYLTTDEMFNLDKELFGGYSPFSYLRPFYIHFYDNNNKTMLKLKAKMYGATVCDIDASRLTHVIVSNDKNLKELKEKLENSNVKIVLADWLKACFEQEKPVPETDFVL